MIWIEYALFLSALTAGCCSIYFSANARRAESALQKGLYSAKLNIAMGAMLIAIASIQLFLFQTSTVRLVVGGVFMVLGLINAYAGIKNFRAFKQMSDQK